MRVRLTPRARRDLFAIWHYIADQSPSVADAVVHRLAERYRKLSAFPRRGVPRPDLHKEARILIVERWLVLYRVRSDEVLVVRIVDGKSDLSRLSLPDDASS